MRTQPCPYCKDGEVPLVTEAELVALDEHRDRLQAELDRERSTHCRHPEAQQCIKAWEAAHQEQALARLGLAAEFARHGSDAIEYVGRALLDAREQVVRERGLNRQLSDRLAAAVEVIVRRADPGAAT